MTANASPPNHTAERQYWKESEAQAKKRGQRWRDRFWWTGVMRMLTEAWCAICYGLVLYQIPFLACKHSQCIFSRDDVLIISLLLTRCTLIQFIAVGVPASI